MPRYTYDCKDCDFHGDIVHSYKQHPGICPACKKDSLIRNLSKKVLVKNKNIKTFEESKNIGDVVESEIRNSSQELKRQKEELKNREKK